MKKDVSRRYSDPLTAKRRAIVKRNRKAWESRKRMQRARLAAGDDGRNLGDHPGPKADS